MKEKNKDPRRYALLGGVFSGIIVHLLGILIPMHNYDDIAQVPGGYGTGVSSGRWMLTILGDFMERLQLHYNLPLVNGLLFLGLIAVAAWFLVEIFEIENPIQAGLVGAMMEVFPAVFSTMIFHYTVVYYGISIVLAVLTLWFFEQYRFGWIVSVLCFTLSLGLYQAYAPLAITIFLLRFLQKLMKEDSNWQVMVRWAISGCSVLMVGLVLYLSMTKWMTSFYNVPLSDYKGTAQMGAISLEQLLTQGKSAYYMFLFMPRYGFWGVANAPLLKLGLVISWILSAMLVLMALWRRRRDWQTWLLAGIACALIPIAVNFILIMCPQGEIYTIMVYVWALVPCIPVVLLDIGVPQWLRRSAVVTLAAMCLCYGYYTNVNYISLYYSNRQVENYVTFIVTQIRMTEGFDSEKKWAFIGTVDDPLMRSPWQYEMSYGGVEPADLLVKRSEFIYWFWNYYGYMPPMPDENELESLAATEEVRQMPCWPDYGSIRIIDDAVVIKFSEK